MTNYSDVPQVSMLYAECENVDRAIALIDNDNGTISNLTIIPQYPPPPEVNPLTTAPMMTPAVMITLPKPVEEATMMQIRIDLVNYQQYLLDQLEQLGVVETPARASLKGNTNG